MPPAPAIPAVDGIRRRALRVRGGGSGWIERGGGRRGGAWCGVGVLRNAVAAAVVGLLPGVVVLMAVPPSRGAGADDEPQKARGGAATAVCVVPMVVHGWLRSRGLKDGRDLKLVVG